MATQPRRRWFQFSLWTLFVVVTISAVVMGWAAYHAEWTWQRREALDWIQYQKRNEHFTMDPVEIRTDGKTPKLSWSLRLFGEEPQNMLFVPIDKSSDDDLLQVERIRPIPRRPSRHERLLRRFGADMKRFSAKLFFQWKVLVNGDPTKVRKCEERIVVINATSARKALAIAKRKGREARHKYKNSDGNPVHFEFIGVIELLNLGLECDDGEVWYDIVDRVRPSERRAEFIPAESQLSAVVHESKRSKPRKQQRRTLA